jgi:hypothetical protein
MPIASQQPGQTIPRNDACSGAVFRATHTLFARRHRGAFVLACVPAQPIRSLRGRMGVSPPGAWWRAGVERLLLTFLDIAGEALWFLGLILPRQEMVHGLQDIEPERASFSLAHE